MGIAHLLSFIDVIQWWKEVWKEMLPGEYQMAMDFLCTPATSTPSEWVNGMTGHEFIANMLSLSSEIFDISMWITST
jgi:hypothetical protein